jgi:CO dehydrogenase maturation factor
VLALDSDTMPGLAYSLGAAPPPEPPLLAAAEKDERGRWRTRRGIGPVRAVQRYATPAPDGVLLLQSGKTTDEGIAPVLGSVTVFYDVVQRIGRAPFFRDWAIVGDLSAGPRQTAYRWTAYADTVLLVVEPTWKSVLTARRIRNIAASISGARVGVVANKLARAADADEIASRLGEPVLAAVPVDEAVSEAERSGLPLLDHAPDAPATVAIARLAERLS